MPSPQILDVAMLLQVVTAAPDSSQPFHRVGEA